ncbi:hypothetical protein [Pseudomonas sp. TMW 2.1634]|uniref:hypothetical protein n=1 Tax=Pseudomonas sp. TMW 2.1634 TaxID=1886807 RepID=UPI000EF2C56B|nr:hypothetical protein [Pseudomonas sp. TMW 2.1634]AOA05696.1 hypothetical protein BFC21_07850 [Pseudomonas sp. TMW 2.1634]AOA08935.1 hypothetical protein BFC21_25365 [Pseudomonas sp. TMW 2.1634]
MAKFENSAAEVPAVAEPVPDRQLTFSDQVYTSRTLIIPRSDRTLSVAKGVVQVLASDTQAVSFLRANAEFQPLKE